MVRGILAVALVVLALGCGEQPTTTTDEQCASATCAALGKTCGAVPDGCGGTLECGSCPAGQSCGAGGTPNVCGVVKTCEPLTCAAIGKTCGTVPDGCGSTLECGSCPAGERCGAGGTPNVCAPRMASVAWTGRAVGLLPNAADYVVSVGSDVWGRRYALATIDSVYVPETNTDGTLRLQTFDASGSVLSAREWRFLGDSTFAMAVSPDGDVYLRVAGACCGVTQTVDLGDVRVAGPAVVKLGHDGTFWQVSLSSWIQSIHADPWGATIVTYDPASVVRLAADGRVLWSRFLWWGEKACTGSPSGDVICAQELSQGDASSGFPGTIRVARLAAEDGSFLWTRDVRGLVDPRAVRAGGDLFLLAGTRSGTLELGLERISSGDAVLLALGADGNLRWVRVFETGTRFASLAVDTQGRAVFGVRPPNCFGHVLHAYEADGAPSWTMPLPTDGTCAAGTAISDSDLGDDGAVFIGGTIWTSMVFGPERLVPYGQEGFVALIAAP